MSKITKIYNNYIDQMEKWMEGKYSLFIIKLCKISYDIVLEIYYKICEK